VADVGGEAVLVEVLIIFAAQIVYVSTMTLRWIILLKGCRFWASIMSLVEVTIWVYALSLVVGNIDDPVRLVAYAGGFAAGTAVGSWLEERLAYGYSMALVVVKERSEVPRRLRERGFAVTTWRGRGRERERDVLLVFYRRSFNRMLDRVINEVEPSAFILLLEPRLMRGGFLERRLPAPPWADRYFGGS